MDTEHFVSGIDIMPTFLDAAGVHRPEGVDGSSFLPVPDGERVFRNESQSGRTFSAMEDATEENPEVAARRGATRSRPVPRRLHAGRPSRPHRTRPIAPLTGRTG